MPRRPRLDVAGFHHVLNRGVARSDIYLCREDRETFLQILCKACDNYKVNIHDYCLMDNHYHLLIETTQENLSLFMRQINSNYAIYFNIKYKRVGHLWQGRYKSWYIFDEEYLYKLFRYIEHNPVKVKLTTKVGEFEFTLMGPLLNKFLKLPKCAEHSMLKKMIVEEGFQDLLEIGLDEDELEALKVLQKKKVVSVEHEYKVLELTPLETIFQNITTKKERNRAIGTAVDEGYKHVVVARFLEVNASMISKVVAKWHDSSPDPI